MIAAIISAVLVGALNPDVTQANIGQTICVHGWAATVRPPVAYTAKLKRRLLPYGSTTRDYTLDHIVPLEVGGAPADPRNFMLQGAAEARRKDRLENWAHRQVCSEQMSLSAARELFQTDWRAAYTAQGGR